MYKVLLLMGAFLGAANAIVIPEAATIQSALEDRQAKIPPLPLSDDMMAAFCFDFPKPSNIIPPFNFPPHIMKKVCEHYRLMEHPVYVSLASSASAASVAATATTSPDTAMATATPALADRNYFPIPPALLTDKIFTFPFLDTAAATPTQPIWRTWRPRPTDTLVTKIIKPSFSPLRPPPPPTAAIELSGKPLPTAARRQLVDSVNVITHPPPIRDISNSNNTLAEGNDNISPNPQGLEYVLYFVVWKAACEKWFINCDKKPSWYCEPFYESKCGESTYVVLPEPGTLAARQDVVPGTVRDHIDFEIPVEPPADM